MNLDSLQNIKVPRQRLDAYEFLPPQDEVDMSELQRYNDAIFCKRMLIGCIIVLIVAISILLWTNTGASLLFSEAVGQSNLSKNKEETS